MAAKSNSKSTNMTDSEEHGVRLQAKRRYDNAWYDCQVSLRTAFPLKGVLNVHFGSSKDGESDTILFKTEAFERVRVRCTEISPGECHDINDGEMVMVLQKAQSGNNQLFDAEVEKIKRANHSNRMVCRCAFQLRWLEGRKKGETMTVPASSIRRLSKENIKIHPTISAFLKTAVSRENSPEYGNALTDIHAHLEQQIEEITKLTEPVERACLEGMTDIHAHLEQQIEEITKLTEPVERACLEGMSFHHTEVNSQFNNIKNCSSAENNIFCDGANKNKVSQRTPPKRTKICVDTLKNRSFFLDAASVLDLETKPRLSPLAARAALAASVWKMPLDEAFMHENDAEDAINTSHLQRRCKRVSLDAFLEESRPSERQSVKSSTKGVSGHEHGKSQKKVIEHNAESHGFKPRRSYSKKLTFHPSINVRGTPASDDDPCIVTASMGSSKTGKVESSPKIAFQSNNSHTQAAGHLSPRKKGQGKRPKGTTNVDCSPQSVSKPCKDKSSLEKNQSPNATKTELEDTILMGPKKKGKTRMQMAAEIARKADSVKSDQSQNGHKYSDRTFKKARYATEYAQTPTSADNAPAASHSSGARLRKGDRGPSPPPLKKLSGIENLPKGKLFSKAKRKAKLVATRSSPRFMFLPRTRSQNNNNHSCKSPMILAYQLL